MQALHDVLTGFAGRVNGMPALRGPLKGWSPEFFIQAREGATWQVRFADGQVQAVAPTEAEPGDDALLLRADGDVLERIFAGRMSPLGAYTDGELEVYGPQKDQIKLDVIALVLWGA